MTIAEVTFVPGHPTFAIFVDDSAPLFFVTKVNDVWFAWDADHSGGPFESKQEAIEAGMRSVKDD